MATMTFGDDTVNNLPGTGLSTETVTINSAYTFNPFAAATVADAGGSDDVTMRLIFSDPAGNGDIDGATMWQKGDGTNFTSVAQGNTLFHSGTAAQVQDWLNSIVVIGWSYQDSFRMSLRGWTGVGYLGSSYSYTWVLACYMQGTMIRTPAGERPVEALQAGDLVTTLDGSAKKVKWIGHRTYEAEFGASEAFVRPVLFRAGSLGGGLPTRDLRVSPQHGMLIDGAMVPAAALVNGVSIVRDTTVADVSYFHVEMDGHEAIFAEGAASETFVDHNSRAIFDNADEYGMLYGTATSSVQEIARLEEGPALAAIRARLGALAGITAPAATGPLQGNLESLENGILTGWVIDGGEAVEADILVDGQPVARVVANRYRADLDQAGLAGGRGGFSVAVPGATSLSQVSLRRTADGQMLAAPLLEAAVV